MSIAIRGFFRGGSLRSSRARARRAAAEARRVAEEILSGGIAVEVLIFDRAGRLAGRSVGDG